jgi:hypothetical protein
VFHIHEKSGPVAMFSVTPGFKDAKRRTRLYRCSNSTARYKERYAGRPEFDYCEGFGVNPQNKKRRRISTRAAEVEARTIVELVKAFRSPETLAQLREDEDRRAVAADETEETLDAAHRERDALAAEELNLAKRLGRLSPEAADAALDDLEARRADSEARVARLEADSESLAGYGATLDELLGMTVDCLSISPSDDTEYDIDTETGERFVIAPGWTDQMDYLESVARSVLEGDRSEAPVGALAWLGEMAARFSVRVLVERGEGGEVVYRFEADRGRVFGGVNPTARS